MVDAVIGADFRHYLMYIIEDQGMKALREFQIAGIVTLVDHHWSGQFHLNDARVAAIVNDVIGDNASQRVVGSQLLDHRIGVPTRKQHHSQKGCDVA
jgi:hypothetical protein